MAFEWLVVGGILLTLFILLLASGLRVVQPYEQGLYIFLGNYRGKLNTGLNFVIPFGSRVIRMDMRTQVMDVPRQEVITKDNSPTNVDALVYARIMDPEKAYFEVSQFRIATIALAQTTLRSVMGDMDLDEILNQRERINSRLQDILDKQTDAWGVRVEGVEIREVDPVDRVKRAMEEQTSAERERRAAILRADGQKKASILEAEGGKRSAILAAEGVRQARILEAEGARKAEILRTQGQAQGLRILSLGASTLDQKALTVLNLEALGNLGQSKSTKIVLPFELTGLIKGAASAVGGASEAPSYTPTDIKALEKIVGTAKEILGDIPDTAELQEELARLTRDAEPDDEEI
jgi:regulator of protease activity HflC (stomatin/prohibitin superfamily)